MNSEKFLEWQCQHHKNIAGQSIWEIGRRLNHVKENDLAHGQFMEWVEVLGINHSKALRMMKVAKEIPNSATLPNLGVEALYLITTLPDEEKQVQLEKFEQGDNPTVRELQDLKRKLKDSEERKEWLLLAILNTFYIRYIKYHINLQRALKRKSERPTAF
ncbi:DUF3102 domain-containing protein [Streptococcus parauberis]|uniref:DUF3102 domain-containing protein n=1 Tax=Streptococcus parauberis TaxID=1348 RepID=UPI0037DA30DA